MPKGWMTMLKPVIGILPLYHQQEQRLWMHHGYLDVLEAAGAIPLVLPLAESSGTLAQLVSICSGLLFPGGGDVDPALFGEEMARGCRAVCPRRDRMELALLQMIRQKDLPVLGICRGIQVMNIAYGGNIYQDLDTQLPPGVKWTEHDQDGRLPDDYPVHPVSILPGSLLHRIVGCDLLRVNSLHHQAVRRIGSGLAVSGQSPDGIAEALEDPAKKFFLGVQWHPERMWQADQKQFSLVQAFVDACR